MNTTTKTASRAPSATLLAALFVASLGAGIFFIVGHAQSATLHDAAHDMRHATGFPCH